MRTPFGAQMTCMRSFKATQPTQRNSSWIFWRDYWTEPRSACFMPYGARRQTCARSLDLHKHARLRLCHVRRPPLAFRLGDTRDTRASKKQRMSHAWVTNHRSIYCRCPRHSGHLRARHATSAVGHCSQFVDRCARERSRHSVFAYSRDQVRAAFARHECPNKHRLAELILECIPAFERYVPPPRKPWMSEDRRMGLFDAAALALVFFRANENQSG